MISDPALWRRISDHEFDHTGCALSFSARLMRENAWAQTFTDRAIEEYRRFIYLSAISQTEATPSDQVDQVWHLHLTYTRDYWETFSGMIGRQVHHNPTSGGEAEQRRYLENYRSTLSLYRLEFDQSPPEDIWPDEAERFSTSQYKRIDVSSHLVLHKPSVIHVAAMAITVVALALAHYTLPGTEFGGLARAGLGADQVNSFISSIDNNFLYIVASIVAIGYVIYRFLVPEWYREHLKKRGGRSDGGCGGGCSGCGGD